jgi:hypothetical protein
MKARYRHRRRGDVHYPRSGGALAAAVAAADATFPAVLPVADGYPPPILMAALTWERTRMPALSAGMTVRSGHVVAADLACRRTRRVCAGRRW